MPVNKLINVVGASILENRRNEMQFFNHSSQRCQSEILYLIQSWKGWRLHTALLYWRVCLYLSLREKRYHLVVLSCLVRIVYFFEILLWRGICSWTMNKTLIDQSILRYGRLLHSRKLLRGWAWQVDVLTDKRKGLLEIYWGSLWLYSQGYIFH